MTIKQVERVGRGRATPWRRGRADYASLVNINAYHQPGVEAGKKAAQAVLGVQAKVVSVLKKELGRELSLDELAAGAGDADRTTVFCVLRHLSANPERGILRRIPDGKSVLDAVYVLK